VYIPAKLFLSATFTACQAKIRDKVAIIAEATPIVVFKSKDILYAPCSFQYDNLYFVNESDILFCKETPNGLRYPRWGGRRNAVQTEKTTSVEKCLELRQNPQRRVHALLEGVLCNSLSFFRQT
jgi:hypothetical protein